MQNLSTFGINEKYSNKNLKNAKILEIGQKTIDIPRQSSISSALSITTGQTMPFMLDFHLRNLQYYLFQISNRKCNKIQQYTKNKMFNYFFFPGSHSYSIAPQPTPSSLAPSAEPSSPTLQKDYSQLLKKFEQLRQKYEKTVRQNNELKKYVNELQQAIKPSRRRRKFKRRMENQLQKEYDCPYDNCKKEYASMLALNLHIRVRHHGGTKKQRVTYAKELIEAESKGLPRPTTMLNIPPALLSAQIEACRSKIGLNAINPNQNMKIEGVQSNSDEE